MSTLLLTACGGGGSNGDAASAPQNSQPTSLTRPSVDGQTLTGTLTYKAHQTSVFQLNLSNGQTTESYNENTSTTDDEERRAALRFSVDAQGQVRVIYRDHGVSDVGMRVWAKRYSGPVGQTLQSLFDVSGNHVISNDSVISPNNQYLMLRWQANDEAPIVLRILNTQGQTVAEYPEPAQFKWLADGRALFLDNDLSIYVSSADFTSIQAMGHLPDSGNITYFTPSPNGQRIAWVGEDNKVRTSLLDGSHLLLVADVKEKLLPVRELTWSPDGQHIAFNHKKAADLPAFGWTGGCEAIWVVPSNGATVIDTYADDANHMLKDGGNRFACVGDSVIGGTFVFLDWH